MEESLGGGKASRSCAEQKRRHYKSASSSCPWRICQAAPEKSAEDSKEATTADAETDAGGGYARHIDKENRGIKNRQTGAYSRCQSPGGEDYYLLVKLRYNGKVEIQRDYATVV